MPTRPRQLIHAEALYIIERLIADRRITPALVAKLKAERSVEMRQLEERLALLRGETGRPGKRGRASSTHATELSPETQASRRLQGVYLNLIRRVPAGQRGRFKEIAQTNGREAAVKAIRGFLDR
jgi:ParB-like chromosome segregation protein Spo0J